MLDQFQVSLIIIISQEYIFHYSYYNPFTQVMLKVLLSLVCLVVLVQSISKITASLHIITYEPLQFNLTFSEPTPLPKFQLLFNQIPINYNIALSDPNASYYIITGLTEGIVNPADNITQKYVLMFTEPLTIASGNLNLDSFLLRAHQTTLQNNYILQPLSQKGSHYKYQNYSEILNVLAIIIVAMIYFLSYTTLIGVNAFNFLIIYVYISIQSPLYTALDYRIAYYMLFEVHQIGANQVNQFLYMCIPHLLITSTFLVGLLSRWKLKDLASRSGIWNYIYYYLSYKLFIITWEIMCLPIFANISHMIQDRIHFTTLDPRIIGFYIYFSMAIILFHTYMAYFTVNPQIGESPEKWYNYIESSHFQLFDGFHLGIDAKDWKKRNYSFVISIIRLLIVIFVSTRLIGIPNLLLQIIYLIYLFTLRPFKYDFFNYINIGIQIFVIVFYLYRYIVELYMSISDQITTSTDITRILLTNIILLCLITFTYFVLGIYEFYQRMRSFRISLQTWNRELKYARRQSIIRKTKHSAFKKEDQDKQRSARKKSPKRSRNSPDGLQIPKMKKTSSIRKQGSPQKDQKTLEKSKSLKQANKQLKESKQASSSGNSPKREKPSRKIKQKSSLLQSISMGHQSP